MSTKTCLLPFGDYALAGDEAGCVVERKSGVRELATNLLSARDARRQGRAFKKLSMNCRCPVLLVEARLSEFCQPDRYVDCPQKVLGRLMAAVDAFGFRLVFSPKTPSDTSRRRVGTGILHMMLACNKVKQ